MGPDFQIGPNRESSLDDRESPYASVSQLSSSSSLLARSRLHLLAVASDGYVWPSPHPRPKCRRRTMDSPPFLPSSDSAPWIAVGVILLSQGLLEHLTR